MLSFRYKLIALSLTAFTLLSLVSCSIGSHLEGTVSNNVITDTDSEDPQFMCDLPEQLNYDTEVTFLYTDMSGRTDELVSESLGGGVILDSVYERNVAVSTRLGVELKYVTRTSDVDAVTAISNLVQGGDRSVDLFAIGTYVCMTPSLSGHYLNLRDIENLDLSKSYWNQDYNEMMTFTSEDLQFVATSPVAISIFRKGYLTIFNRDLFRDYGIADLYEAVVNGDWTLDYQYGIVKDLYADANGDGQMNTGDFYGFVVGNETDMDVYAVASDIHLVVRDENGDLNYNSDSFERLVTMSEKVSSLCHSPGTYLADSYSEGFNAPIEHFSQSKALMATTMFGSIENQIEYLADMSYGIAPIPKLNKAQETYGTYIQDQVSCFGISACIGDENRQAVLGAVLEAMSYYSYLLVRPAYYDSVLSSRFMQDPQSDMILDTMFASISFDYVYATGLGDVRDNMRVVISSSAPAIASKERVWQRQIENALKEQKASFEKILKNLT